MVHLILFHCGVWDRYWLCTSDYFQLSGGIQEWIEWESLWLKVTGHLFYITSNLCPGSKWLQAKTHRSNDRGLGVCWWCGKQATSVLDESRLACGLGCCRSVFLVLWPVVGRRGDGPFLTNQGGLIGGNRHVQSINVLRKMGIVSIHHLSLSCPAAVSMHIHWQFQLHQADIQWPLIIFLQPISSCPCWDPARCQHRAVKPLDLSLCPCPRNPLSCMCAARMEHCPRSMEGDAHEPADDVHDGQQHWALPNHDVGDDGVSPCPGPSQLQGRWAIYQ